MADIEGSNPGMAALMAPDTAVSRLVGTGHMQTSTATRLFEHTCRV